MSPKLIYITLSQASILLPIAFGWIYYKRLTLPFRLLFYFFISCVGFEIQSVITKTIFHNNMPGLHVYTLTEFLVFSSVYYLYFQKESAVRLLIGVNGLLFIAIALIDAFWISGITHPNSVSRSYSFVFLLLYTLIYFYQLFQKDEPRFSWDYPMFWISIGALIYFASNILYFMLRKYLLVKAADIEMISYFAHAAFNIIANLLFAQSFRCFRKPNAEL